MKQKLNAKDFILIGMEKFVLMEKSSHPGSGGHFPILLCRIQTINSLPAAWKKSFPLECRKIAKKK